MEPSWKQVRLHPMLNIMWIGPAYSRSMSGCPHYTNNNQKKLPSLGDFEASPPQQRIYNVANNNYNNNTKLQFLLNIQKKDIFLLSNPADKAFSTTNSPRFYSSAIHLSPIILVFWGLLGVVSYSITESQLSNNIYLSVSPRSPLVFNRGFTISES